MEIKEIEELLLNAKGNLENIELKKAYTEAVSSYLNNQKSKDEIVNIVVLGIEIDGASSYCEYIKNVPKNEISSINKQIREKPKRITILLFS